MLLLTVSLALLSAAPTATPRQALGRQVAAAAADAPRVYAGIYLSDVSGFDLKEGRFQADLDVWLKWSGKAAPPVLRFVNGEIERQEEQERESDGDWHSVRYRVQGTFRGTFPLHAFPFDRQELKIELALPEDTAHLLPDLGSSGMAQEFSITGWEYARFFRAESGKELIASDLGSIRNEGKARMLESVAFVIDLRRPRTSNVIKLLLPLAIILAMAFLGFALPHNQIDARGAIGVTALLSVVAFHFAMAGSLPDVPYLVAADRFFLASYVLVLLSVVETVVVFRLGETRSKLARRLDRGTAAVLTLSALLVGASVITIPMRREDQRAARQQEEVAPPVEEKPAPAPVSARDELRVGVTSLPSLMSHGLGALLRRGLSSPNFENELVPHLAERIPAMTDDSVRLLPDGGMLVTWKLRPGLRWSDGAPLTASDLVFSLGLIDDPDRQRVRQRDEHTIVIRYARRLASALTDFSLYAEHVAKPLVADGGLDALRGRSEPLPSDGPYRLVSWEEGKEARYERNPFFAGPPPAIAHLRVTVMTPEEMAKGLEEGTVDLVPVLPTSLISRLQQSERAEVRSALDETLLHLNPDLSVPALQDPRVRLALLMALDRTAIANAYVDGQGRVAHTFRPSGAADYAVDARQTAYDPEGARRLLAEAGGPFSLQLTVMESPEGTGYRSAADLIAQQLEAAGIALTVRTVTSSQAYRMSSSGEHGGLLLHTRRDVRPARFFNLPTERGVIDTRTLRPHFPERVARLNQLYETSLFPERRVLLSRRLQREFAELLPLLPIAFGAQVSANTRALTGFKGAGQSGSLWWNVEAWSLTQ